MKTITELFLLGRGGGPPPQITVAIKGSHSTSPSNMRSLSVRAARFSESAGCFLAALEKNGFFRRLSHALSVLRCHVVDEGGSVWVQFQWETQNVVHLFFQQLFTAVKDTVSPAAKAITQTAAVKHISMEAVSGLLVLRITRR